MNLLGEKQTWPALLHLPLRASETASVRSASSRTTKGSFPPSSKTHFLRYLPAFSAMAAPPLVEPVKQTPWTEGYSKICSS